MRLLATNDDNKVALVDFVPAVLPILRTRTQGRKELILTAIAFLRNVCSTEATLRSMLFAAPSMVHVARMNMDSSSIIKETLECLCNLGYEEVNCATKELQAALPLAVQALETHAHVRKECIWLPACTARVVGLAEACLACVQWLPPGVECVGRG